MLEWLEGMTENYLLCKISDFCKNVLFGRRQQSPDKTWLPNHNGRVAGLCDPNFPNITFYPLTMMSWDFAKYILAITPQNDDQGLVFFYEKLNNKTSIRVSNWHPNCL